ncbi:BTAD domain-containing putative transcriptional regulator [Actinoplanes sp. NPDC023801]|uniref:AfsR/SARP family transcriptional regulator n=1 Tax=Actinoplanes sp. NPDC023801 TaxID=3154595 RepID=UPI0033D9EF57
MEFRVLGPLQVHGNSGPLPLRGPREQRILAVLLLNHDRLVPLDQLIKAVWDDNPPATAGTQVRNRVSELRRTWAVAVARPDDVLVTEGSGYLLRLSDHTLDLTVYERQVVAARAAMRAGDRPSALRLLRSALGQWRGPAFAGVGGGMIDAAAARWEEHRLSAVEECLGLELDLGRHTHIVDEVTALAEEHPFRERFVHQLMLALYRSGRQADALSAYQRYAERLRDELGLDPGPELGKLHEAVLRRSPGIDAPPAAPAPEPPPAATGVPAPPERDAATAPPATRPPAVPTRPAELPADLVDFSGRTNEIAALDKLFTEGRQRRRGVQVIAVTGTAGVGKTALAVHWAHRVADQFPDGQLHVNLRGHAQGPSMRPVEALATMIRALGVSAEETPFELDDAARLFRSLLAGRQVLLMLDNAESAEQVRPLLPGTSGCVVLVTSRDRLTGLVASHGARRLALDPLGPAEAYELMRQILGESRMDSDPQATQRLVQACAALPLALRIAAANLDSEPHRSVAEYAAELHDGDRLAALRVDGDSQAVQTVFDTSYTALPAEMRKLFRLVGLAPGPDVPAAAMARMAGIDADRAARLLTGLAAAHLIHESGRRRFTSHDLLRLYARKRAEAEDSPEVRDAALGALFDWYLEQARAAAQVLHPHMMRLADQELPPPPVRFGNHAAAIAWLDDERPNLVAAVSASAASGRPGTPWLLADVLRGYFWLRGHTTDWLYTAESGVAAATAHGDLRGEAAARLALGFAHYSRGRCGQAAEQYRAALECSRRAGWEAGQATALSNLGLARATAGDLRSALDALHPAAAIDRRLGRRPGLATTLCALGQVSARLGRARQAVHHFEEALSLYRETDSLSGQAMALSGLALALSVLERHEEAVPVATRSLDIYREAGDADGTSATMDLLARLHCGAGRHREAVEQATTALELVEQTDRRRQAPALLNTLGRAHLALGDAPRARDCHERALAAVEPIEALFQELEAYAGLAGAMRALGSAEAALGHAARALELAQQAGYRTSEGEVLRTLADIHRDLGNDAEAEVCAKQALQIAQEEKQEPVTGPGLS